MSRDVTLVEAAREGNLKQVRELLDQGVDIHAYSDSTLRWAARYGHLEVVKYLVERGADIHVWNDYALRWAARYGHIEVVRYLVERSGYSVEELLTHSEEYIRNYALKEYGDE